ncbi:MAG: hypothetical protein E7075_03580 [Bacteroidales bacterium]|nr:hypothetical protein [Bacteroidales bacterium]
MMTNLQSSAFVAKTTQLLSTVARLRILLVMFLTLTVSANACTKNRFSSYQYVKDRFVGLCLFVWQTTERFFV